MLSQSNINRLQGYMTPIVKKSIKTRLLEIRSMDCLERSVFSFFFADYWVFLRLLCEIQLECNVDHNDLRKNSGVKQICVTSPHQLKGVWNVWRNALDFYENKGRFPSPLGHLWHNNKNGSIDRFYDMWVLPIKGRILLLSFQFTRGQWNFCTS